MVKIPSSAKLLQLVKGINGLGKADPQNLARTRKWKLKNATFVFREFVLTKVPPLNPGLVTSHIILFMTS